MEHVSEQLHTLQHPDMCSHGRRQAIAVFRMNKGLMWLAAISLLFLMSGADAARPHAQQVADNDAITRDSGRRLTGMLLYPLTPLCTQLCPPELCLRFDHANMFNHARGFLQPQCSHHC
jgi:hypothetical protein